MSADMEQPPPGIVTYSYTLLHNRLLGLCDDLVGEVEASEQGNAQIHDPGARALGAIVLADTAIEIGINHLTEIAFPPRGMMPTHWPVFQFAFERLHRSLRPYERLKALAAMMRISQAWDEEPWLSLRDLHLIRNALQHYEAAPVRASDPGLKTFPNEERLRPIAQRLGTWSRYETGGTWLEAFLNALVARWAHNTAQEILHTIRADPWRRGIPFPPSDLVHQEGDSTGGA